MSFFFCTYLHWLVLLLLTIDDWSKHCHTLKVWIAHSFIQNQTTNTGEEEKTRYM